jgi:hypothetical protein
VIFVSSLFVSTRGEAPTIRPFAPRSICAGRLNVGPATRIYPTISAF